MNYKNDFPIFKNNPDLIYLDSAATSQKPQIVLDSITELYSSYNANIHRGLYPIAEKTSAKVEEVREKIRVFINASSNEEIIFTKGTTESINLVASTWGRGNIQKGDKIVVTIMDHHANFVPWQQLALQKNAEFRVIRVDGIGKLNESEVIEKTKDAKLFVLPYVSNVLGSINGVANFVEKVKKYNPDIVVLVDAAQALPFKPVDVKELNCDFLAFSGHKIFAETGVGVLFGKKQLLEQMSPYQFGGDMIREVSIEKTTFAPLPTKFETGTINISGIISLGAAIDYLQSIGMEKVKEHDKSLAFLCREELSKIDGVKVFGPDNKSGRSNIVTFVMDNVHPHDIAQILADDNICVRAGHHCTMPLHAYLGIPASVRVSFSIYNTEEDVEKLIKGLRKVEKIFA